MQRLLVRVRARSVTGWEWRGALTGGGNATDGSIGYFDLATAREKGFTITPTTSQAHDHTYWVPLQTINPSKA